MDLIIDANCVIAGLIKDSVSREIILHEYLHFYSPDYLKKEIRKYKPYIMKKGNYSGEVFEIILFHLFDNILFIPDDHFIDKMDDAIEVMKDIDINDAPYVALGLSLNVNKIWTNDFHFKKQDKLEIYQTEDLLTFLKKE